MLGMSIASGLPPNFVPPVSRESAHSCQHVSSCYPFGTKDNGNVSGNIRVSELRCRYCSKHRSPWQ